MITKIRIKNFKAIQDSGWIAINSLAAFIGNNGSGKSSVIEALELIHLITRFGVNEAFKKWGGLESIRNNAAKLAESQIVGTSGFQVDFNPITVELQVSLDGSSFEYKIELNSSTNNDLYIIQSESLFVNSEQILVSAVSDAEGHGRIGIKLPDEMRAPEEAGLFIVGPSETHLSVYSYLQKNIFGDIYWSKEFKSFHTFVFRWQFVNLNSHIMGQPYHLDKTKQSVRLDTSGINIAEYILDHFKTPDTLNNLIGKMESVLPYLSDIQITQVKEFGNKVFLELQEKEQTSAIPSWLFSAGTLRILALFSLFTAEEKPSAVFIEEVENGLDPRTVGMIVSEIENVFNEGSMQVFLTTHSPYLLDLLPLESIILTEKTNGVCSFSFPKDIEGIEVWRKKFSPGKLYSMGKFLSE